MLQRIRRVYDYVLYKSTFYLLTYLLTIFSLLFRLRAHHLCKIFSLQQSIKLTKNLQGKSLENTTKQKLKVPILVNCTSDDTVRQDLKEIDVLGGRHKSPCVDRGQDDGSSSETVTVVTVAIFRH